MRYKSRTGFRGTMAILLAAACMLFGGGLLWQESAGSDCKEYRFAGVERSQVSALVTLAGSVGKPEIAADRIRRHPWVQWAQAHCGPLGTMHVRVTERRPALRMLPEGDNWGHYIDPAGFRMPASTAFDVPLVRGDVERYNPIVPVRREEVLWLLRAVSQPEDSVDALLSEFILGSDGVRLFTPPVWSQGAVEVLLGRNGFETKLGRLAAFWYQAMLEPPEPVIRWIDLRYEGQVIAGTQEHHGQHINGSLL